ncbi:MAG: T9SS type A sorting domain-containing protein [Chitinophagales bacterium]|nr:T9SS type A sorting domain-containing protein [Chitinophagales bacterium]
MDWSKVKKYKWQLFVAASILKKLVVAIILLVYSKDLFSQVGRAPIFTPLKSWSVNSEGQHVVVQWELLHSDTLGAYAIYRSQDSETFQLMENVKGSTASKGIYAYTDEHPYLGYSFYKLEQADATGTVVFSDVLAISVTSVPTTDFSIRPENEPGFYTLEITSQEANLNLAILDIMGQMVYADNIVNPTGKSQVTLSLADQLAPGVYYVKLDSGKDTFIRQLEIQ